MMLLAASAATAAALGFAIVTQDQAALRASPRDSAAQQASLWQGDALEVRGERMDYLQVYDHRRERMGYVRATQVRATGLQEADAPQLLSVLRFVRDTPGAEAMGIAYAAAYLKAAPAADIGAEPFDALGTMAERLARRASARQGKAGDAVSAHLEVATHYGVTFKSYERDAAITLCYDGEAFRRVLAMASSPGQRARAALALTRHDCVDPALRPLELRQFDRWRADVLDKVNDRQFAELPETLKNRLRLRRAGVWSLIAFDRTRQGEASTSVAAAALRALQDLAGVAKNELTDDDQAEYTEAAIRVGATRWAAEPVLPVNTAARLSVMTVPGEPGETCVLLLDAKRDAAKPLARRCTYGVAWTASVSVNAAGSALALAVQPLPTWRELWVFRRQGGTWTVDVLPPSASNPELGYVEFAGWVPAQDKLLTVREARDDRPGSGQRFRRSFEVLQLDTLAVDKQASTPHILALFRWQDAGWKRGTVSLR